MGNWLGNWKGIRLGQQNKIQLYNLSTDVSEQTDVANMHPEVIQIIEDDYANGYEAEAFIAELKPSFEKACAETQKL